MQGAMDGRFLFRSEDGAPCNLATYSQGEFRMTRFRIALGAVIVLIVAVVVITAVRPPMPPSVNGSASAQVYPVSQRAAAPGFTGIVAWINSAPLTAASLRGKVLLGVTRAGSPSATAVPTDITPELYAGSQRGQLVTGEAYGAPGSPLFYPDPGRPRDVDAIQVTGTWTDEAQYLQADGTGHVRLNFHGDALYVVAGTSAGAIHVGVR